MSAPLATPPSTGCPPTCERPAYDVGAVRVGIVHLGIGAFHRAHQAVYMDDRLAAGRDGVGDLRREPALARHGARRSRPRTGSIRWRSAPARASACA